MVIGHKLVRQQGGMIITDSPTTDFTHIRVTHYTQTDLDTEDRNIPREQHIVQQK